VHPWQIHQKGWTHGVTPETDESWESKSNVFTILPQSHPNSRLFTFHSGPGRHARAPAFLRGVHSTPNSAIPGPCSCLVILLSTQLDFAAHYLSFQRFSDGEPVALFLTSVFEAKANGKDPSVDLYGSREANIMTPEPIQPGNNSIDVELDEL